MVITGSPLRTLSYSQIALDVLIPTQPWLPLEWPNRLEFHGAACRNSPAGGDPHRVPDVEVEVLRRAFLDPIAIPVIRTSGRLSMISFTPLRVAKPDLPALIGMVRALSPLM